MSKISLDRDSRGEVFAGALGIELVIGGDVKGGRIGLARRENMSQVGCWLNNAPMRLISPYFSVTPSLCTCPSSGARTCHFWALLIVWSTPGGHMVVVRRYPDCICMLMKRGQMLMICKERVLLL